MLFVLFECWNDECCNLSDQGYRPSKDIRATAKYLNISNRYKGMTKYKLRAHKFTVGMKLFVNEVYTIIHQGIEGPKGEEGDIGYIGPPGEQGKEVWILCTCIYDTQIHISSFV